MTEDRTRSWKRTAGATVASGARRVACRVRRRQASPHPTGRSRRRITRAGGSPTSVTSRPRTSPISRSRSRSRRGSCAATRPRRSSRTTRCTSSRRIRTSLYALDLTKPGAPLKWKFEPKPRRRGAGRRVLRRRQPRRRLRRRPRLLQHARQPDDRASTRRPARSCGARKLGDITNGRDDDDGAARREGQGARRQQRRRVRRARLADGARRGERQASLWRAYSTGPDNDVLIGPRFKPFYAQDRGKDLGVKTWPPRGVEDRRRHRVGMGLLRPGARPHLLRHRQSRAVESGAATRRQQVDVRHLRARRRTPARRVWFYQCSPHDLHDYDGVNENVLVDLPIDGATRKVLLHPDRNGYLYVMDRATRRGAVGRRRSCTSRRRTRRRPRRPGAASTTRRRSRKPATTVRDICPASPGGKDWQPSAWSPRTRLLYIPHQNLCQDAETYAGELHRRHAVRRRRREDVRRARAAIAACSPRGIRSRAEGVGASRKTSRSGAARSSRPATSCSTARWTAGSRRSMRGRGKLLWQFKTGSGIIGQPITLSRPRRQAVRRRAVRRGRLGRRRRVRRSRHARRDGGDAASPTRMRDLKQRTTQGRHAVCLRASRERRCWLARALGVARAGAGARAPSCASAPIPTTCRSRARTAAASRTASRSLVADDCSARLRTTGCRDRRGFVRKTLGRATLCDVRDRRAGGFERALTTRPYYRWHATCFVYRAATAHAPLRVVRRPAPAQRCASASQLVGNDLAATPPALCAGAARRRGQRDRLPDVRRRPVGRAHDRRAIARAAIDVARAVGAAGRVLRAPRRARADGGADRCAAKATPSSSTSRWACAATTRAARRGRRRRCRALKPQIDAVLDAYAVARIGAQ